MLSFLRSGILAVLLLAAAATDWNSRRIPNRLVLWGLFIGLLLDLWTIFSSEGAGGSLSRFLMALAGAVLLGGLHLLPYLSGGMGAGDVKLAFMLGYWLGLPELSSYLGCYSLTLFIGTVLLLFLGKRRPKTLPLAPFIAFSWILYAGMYIR